MKHLPAISVSINFTFAFIMRKVGIAVVLSSLTFEYSMFSTNVIWNKAFDTYCKGDWLN